MKSIRRALIFGIVYSSLLTAGMAQPDEMKCNYTSRFSCSPKGCKPVAAETVPQSFVIVPQLSDLRQFSAGDELPEIRRCDAKGCSPVQIVPTEYPASMRLSSMGGGYFFSITTSNLELMEAKRGQFVEVTSLFGIIFVSYGTCPVPDEDVLTDTGP